MFSSEVKATKKSDWRQVLLQMLSLAQIISPVVIIWFSLVLVTNSQSPVVVVLSESMEPAFSRGDVLFLTNPVGQGYANGDIVVYNVPGAAIPIVHRVLETHSTPKLENMVPAHPPNQLLLTKGDNNPVDDLAQYRGLEWLERKHIVGKVRGFLPYVGYVTIALNDDPRLKYVLLGLLSLSSLVRRE